MLKAILVAVFIVSLWSSKAHAQASAQVPAAWQYLLEEGSSQALADASAHLKKDSWCLLQLNRPMKQQQLQQLSVQLYRKLDELHWIVRLSSGVSVNWRFEDATLYQVNHRWKLSPNMLDQQHPEVEKQEIFVLKGVQHDLLKSAIYNLAGHVVIQAEYAPAHTMLVKCSYQVLYNQLLPLSVLLFVDTYTSQALEESRLLDANTSLNGINIIHHQYPEWQGQGMLISLKEQKYDETDLDLLARHITTPQEAAFVSPHATEMATLIAGAGNSSLKSRGVVPQAWLTSSSFQNLLPDPDAYFQDRGIVLQNHSYGTSPENFYGAEAAAYDASSLQNPKVLHVFSSGNSGTATSTVGTYQAVPAFANLTGNFKQAKNILVVGALDTLKNIDPFVSKGPAYDGRVKPELVAYSSAGSSSAAALVSGAAALLQQAYQASHQGQAPPAALLKAVMINTAEDVGLTGLDYLSGYGSLQAHRALESLQNQQYFRGVISGGEVTPFTISVPEHVEALTLTLVWHDKPAPANSVKALVNDLDLRLTEAGSANVWLPWVLNAYPHEDSLRLPAKRGVDRLNNVEQIRLQRPKAGTYTMQVSGYDIPEGPQSFILAYDWQLADSIRWIYPTGSDYMPMHGERSSIFRWESTYGAGTEGSLEISMDGGASWQMLSNAVALDAEYYQWQAPDYLGTAIARIAVGGRFYTSDSFVISRSLQTNVGFNCEDSLMISWRGNPAAKEYILYALGETYLEQVLRTADTLAVLDKQQFGQQYYAVAPVLEGGQLGLRSAAFDYSLQGVDCYFSNFLAQPQEDGIALSLAIGTTYRVETISFEVEFEGEFRPITSLAPAVALTYEYLDTSPAQGYNTYRARLLLADGTALFSEPQSVYFLDKDPAHVFPNPLVLYEGLNVFLKVQPDSKTVFVLYDLKGHVVYQQLLYIEHEQLLLPPLAPGLYLYKVNGAGMGKSGKLVVK